MTELDSLLKRIGACEDAREWAKTQPDLQTAWANCKRSDWMLWLLSKTTVDKNDPRFRIIACDFAEAVLYLVPEGENRPRKAIEVVRRFALGEATRKELADARAAAKDAASAASWDAASAAKDAAKAAAKGASWYAAWNAAWAAALADARAAAWNAASAASRNAARDAAWNAWDAAWNAARAAQADTIRRYFPECPNINLENK